MIGAHLLVSCRCADDHTVSFLLDDTGQFGHNGESSTVHYSFEMFRFTTEPLELYLHCTVQLCAPDHPESCKPVSCFRRRCCSSTCQRFSVLVLLCSVQNCNSISKREAVRAEPPRGLLTYGPIKVDVPETLQSSKLLSPRLLVQMVALGLQNH